MVLHFMAVLNNPEHSETVTENMGFRVLILFLIYCLTKAKDLSTENHWLQMSYESFRQLVKITKTIKKIYYLDTNKD